MVKEVIKLEKINKTYFGEVDNQVLFDIDLTIRAGTKNALIGQSGSGKTTLMNIIGTLDDPTGGRVFINGVRTDQMSKKELAVLRNETIGFIFQFHYLLMEFSVLENVLMPAQIKGKITEKEKKYARDLISLVGLKDVINSSANKISGGQQQRVAIARALMNKPQIILAYKDRGQAR